jgi:CheY-like chemotaxis protein
MEAMDGQTAIEIASQHRPDLILMDIGLPKRSGISAAYKIRKDLTLREVPIVAVTGSDTADLHEDALRAGQAT